MDKPYAKCNLNANACLPCLTQILEALGRKVTFAPSVDLAALADVTDGFSGADLQALVYNAHLEVVHDAISVLPSDADSKTGQLNGDAESVKYTVLGGGAGSGKVLSRAEESALQRRVRTFLSPWGAQGVYANESRLWISTYPMRVPILPPT